MIVRVWLELAKENSMNMIFSILRRLSSSAPLSCRLVQLISMTPPPLSLRDPSQRIAALARQLRLYQSRFTFDKDDKSEKEEPERQQQQQLREEIPAKLGFAESLTPIARNPGTYQPLRAAVLVCIFEGECAGDWRVILTKRSSTLSTHSGEVSLPGGKSEPGDKDDRETAMREAKEEIGLDPSLLNIVTTIEPFVSKQAIRIVPVIAVLTDKNLFNPAPNPAEVEEIFDAPLEMFIKDENRRFEERLWMEKKYLIHYFDYKIDNKQYLIWGLTAGILIRAASIVYRRPPAFLEQISKL